MTTVHWTSARSSGMGLEWFLVCTLLLSRCASHPAVLAPAVEPDDAPRAVSSIALPTTPPFPIPKRIPKLPSKLVANDSSPKGISLLTSNCQHILKQSRVSDTVIPVENKPVSAHCLTTNINECSYRSSTFPLGNSRQNWRQERLTTR